MERDNIEEKKEMEFSPFLQSLDTITPAQLGAAPIVTPEEMKRRRSAMVQRGISVLSLLVFLAALGYMIYRVIAYQQASSLYSSLEDEFFQTNENVFQMKYVPPDQALTPLDASGAGSAVVPNTGLSEEDRLQQTMKLQLARLRKKNDEVFGWIRLEGCGISYPLLHGKGNDYYLFHAYDGSYNPTGSIFLDSACSSNLTATRNALIYGHNMDFGTPMFHNLLKYKSQGFYESNPTITVYTEDAVLTYSIYSVYTADDKQIGISYLNTRFESDRLFELFCAVTQEESEINTGIIPNVSDHVLTLCTCDKEGEERFVVHAILTNDSSQGEQ